MTDSSVGNIFENLGTLKTSRLLLRKIREADAQDIFEYASDPEVIKYSIGEPHATVEDSSQFINSVLEAYQNNAAGLWAITIQGNDKVIGTCGYELWIAEHYRAEIGYSLAKAYWSNGYMTEALKAVIYYSFNCLDLERLEAICHADNIASLKVLKKIGFSYEGLLKHHTFSRGNFFDVQMYALLREEFNHYMEQHPYRIDIC